MSSFQVPRTKYVSQSLQKQQTAPPIEFSDCVHIIFRSWTGLQLAIHYEFVGQQTKLKAEWLHNFVTNLLRNQRKNKPVEYYDLSDTLADILAEEFNTNLEDESEKQIARTLCDAYTLHREKRYAELQDLLSKCPVAKVTESEASKDVVDQEVAEDELREGEEVDYLEHLPSTSDGVTMDEAPPNDEEGEEGDYDSEDEEEDESEEDEDDEDDEEGMDCDDEVVSGLMQNVSMANSTVSAELRSGAKSKQTGSKNKQKSSNVSSAVAADAEEDDGWTTVSNTMSARTSTRKQSKLVSKALRKQQQEQNMEEDG